jgi:histidinol-phosphate/aromatic aminotransferase/cobyric acid decarboxylase-like protein
MRIMISLSDETLKRLERKRWNANVRGELAEELHHLFEYLRENGLVAFFSATVPYVLVDVRGRRRVAALKQAVRRFPGKYVNYFMQWSDET